jgi:hypothetical protein
MKQRVVAIAPEVETWKNDDFELFPDEACLTVLPRKDVDNWKKWYKPMREGGFEGLASLDD